MSTIEMGSLVESLVENVATLAKSLGGVRRGLTAVAKTRSVVYTSESLMIPLIEFLVNRKRPALPMDDPDFFKVARQSLNDILAADVDRIERGIYPLSVLWPESPAKHLRRIPLLLAEGFRASLRRRNKKARVFGPEAQDLLRGLPEYYQRNFHYQGDGYLSERSADIYEHQVEVLFGGAADAMRRLIIEPMRRHFGSVDGEGLTFLEVAAGTGRSTLFVRLAFPKAKIVAVDLSGPYLKRAQIQLAPFQRHDFVEANAEKLSFQDQSFDAVFSVFLFHELPLEAREKVLKEGFRVLKPGGFYGFVDSLQMGDTPAFDKALELFPIQYHEPFYRNYIDSPMGPLMKKSGFDLSFEGTGFFSKVIAAKKSF